MIDELEEEHLSAYLVSLLTILESYLRKSASTLIDYFNKSKEIESLIKLIVGSLRYNPIMPGFLDEGMEEEELENEEDEQEED